MFGFLSKIFKKTSDSEISELDSNIFEDSNEKKNKLYSNEEVIYYIHTEPDPVGRNEMENTSTIIMDVPVSIYDQATGRQIPMNQVSMEDHSPGVNIPGIGFVQPNTPKKPQRPQGSSVNNPIQIDSEGSSIPINSDIKIPNTEIILTSDAYQVYIDMAGVKKSNVKLTFTDGVLTISGTRVSMIDEWKQMSKGKGRKNTVVTTTSTVPKVLLGQFSFKYPFKKSVDESSIEAKFMDGILHVTLPLRAKSDAVSIAII
jgi:HSP20 family protein